MRRPARKGPASRVNRNHRSRLGGDDFEYQAALARARQQLREHPVTPAVETTAQRLSRWVLSLTPEQRHRVQRQARLLLIELFGVAS